MTFAGDGRHHGRVVGNDVLAVEVRRETDSPWGNEVVFTINGVALFDLARHEGVDRDWIGPPLRVISPPSDHLLGGTDRWEDPEDSWFEDKVAIGACSCGQPGCEALLMRVELPPGSVRWTSFEWFSGRGADLSRLEFQFDRADYERLLAALRDHA